MRNERLPKRHFLPNMAPLKVSRFEQLAKEIEPIEIEQIVKDHPKPYLSQRHIPI